MFFILTKIIKNFEKIKKKTKITDSNLLVYIYMGLIYIFFIFFSRCFFDIKLKKA